MIFAQTWFDSEAFKGQGPLVMLLAGILFTVLKTGLSKTWVWGYQLTERDDRIAKLERQVDTWKDLALELLQANREAQTTQREQVRVTDRSLAVAEKILP